MKTKKRLFRSMGNLVVLSCFIISCSTVEKAAVKCPDFTQNKYYKLSVDQKKFNSRKVIVHHRATKRKQSSGYLTRLLAKNRQNDIYATNNSFVQENYTSPIKEQVNNLPKIEYLNGLMASTVNTRSVDLKLTHEQSTNNSPYKRGANLIIEEKSNVITQPVKCDTIVLNSGSVIFGKVEEIGQDEVKYRNCDNLTGPMISIRKSGVSVVKYASGTKDFFTTVSSTTPGNYNDVAKTEGLGLAGFVSGIVGLIVAGIPLGLLAMTLGSISLGKIKSQPAKYKGKGFALASIIIGTVAFIGAIIVLLVVYL